MVGVKGSSVWIWEDGQVEVWFVLVSIPKVFTSDPKIYGFRLAKVLQVSLPAPVKQSTLRKHATIRFAPSVDLLLTYQTTTMLAVPLRTRNGIQGVLELVNKPDGVFNKMTAF